MYADMAILDGLGYLPFSASGGALLFRLLSKLYEHGDHRESPGCRNAMPSWPTGLPKNSSRCAPSAA